MRRKLLLILFTTLFQLSCFGALEAETPPLRVYDGLWYLDVEGLPGSVIEITQNGRNLIVCEGEIENGRFKLFYNGEAWFDEVQLDRSVADDNLSEAVGDFKIMNTEDDLRFDIDDFTRMVGAWINSDIEDTMIEEHYDDLSEWKTITGKMVGGENNGRSFFAWRPARIPCCSEAKEGEVYEEMKACVTGD